MESYFLPHPHPFLAIVESAFFTRPGTRKGGLAATVGLIATGILAICVGTFRTSRSRRVMLCQRSSEDPKANGLPVLSAISL